MEIVNSVKSVSVLEKLQEDELWKNRRVQEDELFINYADIEMWHNDGGMI